MNKEILQFKSKETGNWVCTTEQIILEKTWNRPALHMQWNKFYRTTVLRDNFKSSNPLKIFLKSSSISISISCIIYNAPSSHVARGIALHFPMILKVFFAFYARLVKVDWDKARSSDKPENMRSSIWRTFTHVQVCPPDKLR